MLSVSGKKVLHMDRQKFYGGESASLTPMDELFKKFGLPAPAEDTYGRGRDWNVDLIPKFIMANGLLVKMLLHTKVTRYLEWKCIDGSYVMQHVESGMFSSGGNKVYKVPSNDQEALKSSLLGFFEKKNCRNFYMYVDAVKEENPMTWSDFDLKNGLMKDLYAKYKITG